MPWVPLWSRTGNGGREADEAHLASHFHKSVRRVNPNRYLTHTLRREIGPRMSQGHHDLHDLCHQGAGQPLPLVFLTNGHVVDAPVRPILVLGIEPCRSRADGLSVMTQVELPRR